MAEHNGLDGKLMTVGEAVERFVHDGDQVCVGGFTINRNPMAVTYEDTGSELVTRVPSPGALSRAVPGYWPPTPRREPHPLTRPCTGRPLPARAR